MYLALNHLTTEGPRYRVVRYQLEAPRTPPSRPPPPPPSRLSRRRRSGHGLQHLAQLVEEPVPRTPPKRPAASLQPWLSSPTNYQALPPTAFVPALLSLLDPRIFWIAYLLQNRLELSIGFYWDFTLPLSGYWKARLASLPDKRQKLGTLTT
jgi:hypothetical protein